MEPISIVGQKSGLHESPSAAPPGALERLVPRCYLRRTRAFESLADGAPVTLVVGPAGAGKTSAVADWALASGTEIAWVDVADAAASRTDLWTTVAEAFGEQLTSLDRRRVDRSPMGDVVLDLATALGSTLERETTLVIDDYHLGEDDDLAASMGLFLRHLPPRLRMVIISRRVPRLAIDRMRVAGDLGEVDVDDLRFSSADATGLVEMLVPDADPAAVESIVAASDGWAAALQLCARAWRDLRQESPEIELLTRQLDEFVLREVLGGESDELLRFLGDVATVERTSIALAEAIAERPDADALIELASERGLHVARVGVSGDHEIHSAVRRALLADRARRDPARLTACRRRAATWLAAHGDTVPALEQWLQAGDHDQALHLLSERHLQLYDAGEEVTVRELLTKLLPGATSTDVDSLIDLAWCQLSDVASFRQCVDDIVWWTEHGADIDPEAERRLHALRSLSWLSIGEWDRAESEARAALEGYGTWETDPIVQTSWNDVARVIAVSERWDDASDEVREITVLLRRSATRTVALEATRALGLAIAGCPLDALRVADVGRASGAAARLTMSSNELALAEVLAHREIGDAAGAGAELERLLGVDAGPFPYIHGFAALELVQHHLDRGSVDDASRAFQALEQVVADEMGGSGGAGWLGRAGTVLSVEAGDLDQARRWAEKVDDEFWGPVSRARAIAGSDPDLAARLLGSAEPRCPRHAVVLGMLRAATTPDREEAAAIAEPTVRLASANQLLQTVASAGQLELIERIAWCLPSDWMDRLRRATANARPEVHADMSLIDPLTVRERDVLRFLPSRLTLKEIADELFVSVNTLKFHLKVIYRKLGVTSRAEAADIARSWGRVDRR